MKFILVKLQTCRYIVQTAILLYTEITTDSFWNMLKKLAVLTRMFFWEKVYGVACAFVLIKL